MSERNGIPLDLKPNGIPLRSDILCYVLYALALADLMMV